MPFPPKQDHKIPLAEAAALTKRHRDGSPAGAQKAQMFPREVFESLLANPNAKGIRLYYGRGPDGSGSMIAVAVDSDGNDMLADGDIFDRGFPCPPVCTATNALNP